MNRATVYHADHRVTMAAPPGVVYDLVADSGRWPAIFIPTVYVRHLAHDRDRERFELWAMLNDDVRSWRSRRGFDRERLTVSFEQEHSQPPIASMGGEWRVQPRDRKLTELVLLHHFTAFDDDPATVARIHTALDTNSARELGAIRRIAELGHPVEDLVFSFTDTIEVPGAAADAYDFIRRADLWADRLPHVGRVDLREPQPGIQDMVMDTLTADGSRHTTRSIRICFPSTRIVYKQLVPPAIMLGHSGSWTFESRGGRAHATAQHTVAVNPAAVTEVVGEGASIPDAREYVRNALQAGPP